MESLVFRIFHRIITLHFPYAPGSRLLAESSLIQFLENVDSAKYEKKEEMMMMMIFYQMQ